MVFSSLLFLFRFMPLALLIYFIMPKKMKNAILFIISLVFYAWGEPVYVVIMLFSTVVDYINGALVSKYKIKGDMKKARFFVVLSVIINLGLLSFFKYIDFFINNLNVIFGLAIPVTNLPLPIGISFYTFQTMSYTIDVYRGDAAYQRNIISFGTYVTMFPQLIAGPIVQYKTVDEQLRNRKITSDTFSDGIMRFICGLGKKVLFANNIGLLWDEISVLPLARISVLSAWLGITSFAFQIYFDFSGYSDMAIGLGKMFGFDFNENFNYPYISKSITEFWRRWHISLGTWFRDYVYIPLGGNRCGRTKHIRNILVVWALTGIWHGAGWNFALWGLYYGLLLIIEKYFLGSILDKCPSWVNHVYVILLTWIGWVFFAFDNLGTAIRYLGVMFGINATSIADNSALFYFSQYAFILAILIFASTDLPKKIYAFFVSILRKRALTSQDNGNTGSSSDNPVYPADNRDIAVSLPNQLLRSAYVIVVTLFVVAYLVDASYNPFLYFRF